MAQSVSNAREKSVRHCARTDGRMAHLSSEYHAPHAAEHSRGLIEPVAQPAHLVFSTAISARSARICPFPGKAAAGVAVSSRIQRRSTLFATSRSRAACATATPRSVTSFTASILNSRLNFRLVISARQFPGHDLIFVSTKPAAVHNVWSRSGLTTGVFPPVTQEVSMKEEKTTLLRQRDDRRRVPGMAVRPLAARVRAVKDVTAALKPRRTPLHRRRCAPSSST